MDMNTMLTVKNLMRHYRVCDRTIRRWMKQGLPFYKTGYKMLRFDPLEVKAWFREKAKKGLDASSESSHS